MGDRQQSLHQLAAAMQASYDAYRQVRSLLIDELADYQQKTLLYVNVHGETDARALADEHGWQLNMSSETLRELWKLGLLDRREERDGSRHFVYEVKR